MSTLDGPIWSRCSIAPPGHISNVHKARKNGARDGMNVTAHQEKKHEKTKAGKRRAGEERKRKQAIDFEKTVCCPSAVVLGAAQRRNEVQCPGLL